jgi:hypothetical protein
MIVVTNPDIVRIAILQQMAERIERWVDFCTNRREPVSEEPIQKKHSS